MPSIVSKINKVLKQKTNKFWYFIYYPSLKVGSGLLNTFCMINVLRIGLCIFLLNTTVAWAQSDTLRAIGNDNKSTSNKKWYDHISLRGYLQVRYNRLLESNENLSCEQCDRSWGKGGGFFIRRMRLIFFGQISPQVYFYIQPDLASSPSSDRLHFAQIRDAYFDISLDKNKTYRLRIGQSKVPYGFENLQSSQNRIALDRTDAINSAVANERDLGVFFYWATPKYREIFSELVRSGLKGSGDYGVLGVGIYNGQTANNIELNTPPHIVARMSIPLNLKRQTIEIGIQGYMGKYVLPTSNISTGVQTEPDASYSDQRLATSFVLYPKPLGIQAEYNIGTGPEYDKLSNSIKASSLQGGYMQISYKITCKKQTIFPFVRYHYYDGGKKHERDARSHEVSELEMGLEWQPIKNFELVTNYTISSRRFEDAVKPENFQKGQLLRIQAQLNF